MTDSRPTPGALGRSRREFLRHVVRRVLDLTVGGKLLQWTRTGAASASLACAIGSPRRRPDVLFIAIDDLNDWVAALGGYPKVLTPNLDLLMGRGVLFTRAYCSASECNPSRVSVMAGLLPSTTGIYRNDQPFRDLLPDVVTLNEYFRRSGYRVVGGGKIYHGIARPWGDPDGWDEYFQPRSDPVPSGKAPARAGESLRWGALDVPEQEMADVQLVDWARRQLGQAREEPLFLACGFEKPHLPWHVPKKYFDLYPIDAIVLPQIREDDLEDVPEMARRLAMPERDFDEIVGSGRWAKAVRGYLASISFTDACIGRLLDGLDADPSRGTVIVLWSDHGFHLGEKLHFRKFTLWEESSRVPLVMVAPGIAPGICERTVSLLDLYPTLAELCGLPPRADLEGSSLVPLLEDPSGTWDRPALTTFGRNNHAVRTERWRYIRYADGSEELYDHTQDPEEWTNLASLPSSAEIKSQLSRWLPGLNVEEAPRVREEKEAKPGS